MPGRTYLEDGWKVEAIGGSAPIPQELSHAIDARVPGCVHRDLIEAGIIQHPDLGEGELEQSWVGRTHFRWRRTIGVDEMLSHRDNAGYVCIVFNSIDTVASIRIDGVEMASVQNQFHPHEVKFKSVNQDVVLEIDIAAPVDELARLVSEYGDRPVNADGEWGVVFIPPQSGMFFWLGLGPTMPGFRYSGKGVLGIS